MDANAYLEGCRGDVVVLNALGVVAEEEWLQTAVIRAEVDLDEYVILPNHLHGIVVIEKQATSEVSGVGATGRSPEQGWNHKRGIA